MPKASASIARLRWRATHGPKQSPARAGAIRHAVSFAPRAAPASVQRFFQAGLGGYGALGFHAPPNFPTEFSYEQECPYGKNSR